MRFFRLSPLLLLGVCLLSGCSYLGYQRYRPKEINEYDEMLADPLEASGDQGWLWVRGKVSGDLDADKNDEEVVIATWQKGDMTAPAPFTRAILLICRRSPKGELDLLLRRSIFEGARSMNEASLPASVHLARPESAMRNCAVTIVDVGSSGEGLILVSLWGTESQTTPAWHAGYRFVHEKGRPATLRRVFCTLAIQRDVGVITADLDKDGLEELLLNQMVISPQVLPSVEGLESPQWLSVFTSAEDGGYRQATSEFPAAHAELLLSWYQTYVQALHGGAASEALAPLEYYIGQIHRFCGQAAVATRFLRRAQKAGDDRLKHLAEDALRACAAKADEDGESTPE